LGYAVNAVTGPVGVTLTMAGHAWLNLVDQAAALVVRGLLGVWLIPRMGVLGAAVASATAMVLANVLRVWHRPSGGCRAGVRRRGMVRCAQASPSE